MEDYRSFLANFLETPMGFVPRDPSQNQYRHFGFRKEGKLYLTKDEVLYLHDQAVRDEYPVRTKAYFFIRNSCYNLLPTESGEFLLYKRHKNFNRNKDKPLYPLIYVDREESIKDVSRRVLEGVCCVVSDSVFTLLKIKRVEKLDFGILDKLNKTVS